MTSGESRRGGSRRVLLLPHTGRQEAVDMCRAAAEALTDAGIRPVMLAEDFADTRFEFDLETVDSLEGAKDCELVIVLGGDGSILRAAELAWPHDVPILGLNLGHVGFLAEVEKDELQAVVETTVARDYRVEERLVLDVGVMRGETLISSCWAINEASIEKAARERMLEVVVAVDDHPLSRWGCDGVVVATPTGSTAYAWSAGGPVVWPTVETILLVPISAHALFSRPMVVAPNSEITVELTETTHQGVMWCDGRRLVELLPGDRVEVSKHQRTLKLARLHNASFADRLVAKFNLPVEGWRGRT